MDRSWSDDLKEIILSFELSDDLEKFAEVYGVRQDPFIVNRLTELKWKELQFTLQLPTIQDDHESEPSAPKVSRNQHGGRDNVLHRPGTSQQLHNHVISRQHNNAIPYQIKKKSEKTFLKSSAKETTFHVEFIPEHNENKKLNQLHDELHHSFDNMLEEAKRGYQEGDLARVVIQHADLDPIVVPLQPIAELDANIVLEHLENTLTSHEDLGMDESFSVNIGCISVPKGGKKSCLKKLTGKQNSIRQKKGMVEIRNRDLLCLARAIGVSFCSRHNVSNEEWLELTMGESAPIEELVLKYKKAPPPFYDNIKRGNRKTQERFAKLLSEKARVPIDRMGTLLDIPKFEDILNVNIQVLGSRTGNKFVRVVNNTERKNIYIYLSETNNETHFHSIIKIKSMFSESYFCETCLKAYQKGKHQCSTKCIVCKQDQCIKTENQMSCRKCHMTCRSYECYQSHVEGKKVTKNKRLIELSSECEKYWKCTICKKVLERKHRDPVEHICGEYVCQGCHRIVQEGHLCYLRALPFKESSPNFIFFDAEATQETKLQCPDGYCPQNKENCCECAQEKSCKKCLLCKHCRQACCGKDTHVPNLIVAHKACSKCMDKPLSPSSKCKKCGSRCSKCSVWDEKRNKFAKQPCFETCGFRETVFEGAESAKSFCEWVFTEEHKNSTLVSHNGKGYDNYFLLEFLIDNSILPSKSIFNGSKAMYVSIARDLNIRIIDSLNFLPMRLSALPKAFGLTELKKGYFPHGWNILENQSYVGPYPEPKHYGFDAMSADERKEFLKWHSERVQNGDIFDFKKEMLEYCRSDVDILRQACLQFRSLMMEITSEIEDTVDLHTGEQKRNSVRAIDPFQNVTIASVCQNIFRKKFLKEDWKVKLKHDKNVTDWQPAYFQNDQLFVAFEGKWVPETELFDQSQHNISEKEFISSPLAMVPTEGYSQRDQFSKVSIQWLEWLMYDNRRKGNPLNIQHALNGGEYKVPGSNYKLDGYCNNTAYEFLGCLWHGCPECFSSSRQSTKLPRTKQSIDELYALTIRKKEFLQKKGMKYVCIWEHEFQRQMQETPEVYNYVESLDIQDRLNPRDSFFGGRTNACTLHYEVEESEQIKYVDFTSLYPYVNKYCRYPVGHPEIITKDFLPLDRFHEYFGIAKVKIRPPRGLYHPVLPVRSKGKLKFPLCRTCADNESQSTCKCSDEKRSITGTYCTPEVNKAIEMGYTLQKVYEVYHFPHSTQYDYQKGNGGLFVDYINTFLKIKQEASGWPSWVNSEMDKDRYINDYYANEGIWLEKHKIKKNPGLRSLAKLCLNSFWGKFGESLYKRQTEYIHESTPEQFFSLICDQSKDLRDFHIITDDIIQMEWVNKQGFLPDDMRTNIFLASFTTCMARLKLYSLLERVNENALYFDTDSLIYVRKCGSYSPPLGDYLGELTDELDNGEFIVQFVSAGPKNYAYRTNSGKETCKVRGFSLNYTNSQLINFDVIKDIVSGPKPENQVTITNSRKICREKRKRKLYNREENKIYRMVYTKRVIDPLTLDTFPYGY